MKKPVFRAELAAMALIFVGLSAGCAGQRPGRETEMEYSSAPDMEQGKMDEIVEMDDAGREESAHGELPLNDSASVRVLEDLGAEASLLSEPFYLAGDSGISCMVYIDRMKGRALWIPIGFSSFFQMTERMLRLWQSLCWSRERTNTKWSSMSVRMQTGYWNGKQRSRPVLLL